MSNAIEIKNLTKRFKDVVAVNGLSLTVKEGELFALLGENGAGKSTTVRILCGLSKADSGEAKICGHDVCAEECEVKKIVALSPQETAVAPNLTVKENLRLVCDIYGFDKATADKRIEDVCERLRLQSVLDKRAKKLSGGMQRRLSIAMAVACDPKVLFLDEPTLGLDVRARRDLWALIRSLKGKITVVLTTHYMEEAESLSDTIGIMKDGKEVFIGNLSQIKEKYGADSLEDAFIKATESDAEEADYE